MLKIEDLDAPAILSFLGHLEYRRSNSVRSRNVRLAAIRSFFRFVVFRLPETLPTATRVLAIPVKRVERKMINYLSYPEMQAILAAPDRSTWSGRRDHALLLTFYNTGARVSELRTLEQSQVRFEGSTHLRLHGKGRKEREIPLWTNTARVLKAWFDENGDVPGDVAFPNARGSFLSSDGVSYILRQAWIKASVKCPSLSTKRVTPHVLRHTTAMHLLQSGVDISIIALWLGHESIETTHMYVEADLATKERVLEKLAAPNSPVRRFKADDELLAFLSAI
jgi:site-specific recombinase XerD